MYFLEHIMGIPALFRAGQVPVHVEYGMLPGFAVSVIHAYTLPVQNANFLVLQENDIARMTQQRRDIRCDKPLSVLCADHQRAVVAGAEKSVGFLIADHAQGVASLQHPHGADERTAHVALIEVVEQVGDYLGIRLADEACAGAFQISAQGLVVFNDAVMHHRDAALHIRMGMGVEITWFAMRGPARMTDADHTLHRALGKQVFQVFQPALGLAHTDASLRPDHRHARAVIAPIRQPLQSLNKNRRGLLASNIANDSAHA